MKLSLSGRSVDAILVAAGNLGAVFEASLRSGLESIERLSAEAAEELGLELSIVTEYLTRNLSFTLGEQELGGLEEYFRRAHAHGLIDAPSLLRFRG